MVLLELCHLRLLKSVVPMRASHTAGRDNALLTPPVAACSAPCVKSSEQPSSASRQTLLTALPEERGALAPRQRLLRRHRPGRQPHAAGVSPLRPAVLADIRAAVARRKPQPNSCCCAAASSIGTWKDGVQGHGVADVAACGACGARLAAAVAAPRCAEDGCLRAPPASVVWSMQCVLECLQPWSPDAAASLWHVPSPVQSALPAWREDKAPGHGALVHAEPANIWPGMDTHVR